MTTWFTSDWHLFHEREFIYKARGFDSNASMREALVSWNNENVKDEDDVWNIGDVTFGQINPTIEVLEKLKGRHHLVLGNHDHIIKKNIHIFKKYFVTVQEYKEIKIDKHKIILMHYPMRSWNGSNYGSYMLHGHTHGSIQPYGLSVDIGLDSDFITGKRENRYFSFEEVKKFMDSRSIIKDYGD